MVSPRNATKSQLRKAPKVKILLNHLHSRVRTPRSTGYTRNASMPLLQFVSSSPKNEPVKPSARSWGLKAMRGGERKKFSRKEGGKPWGSLMSQ